MNSLFNKHRWMQVMWGILLFVAGAITIIFTATSDEGTDSYGLALAIALAVVLFAYALTILFTTFLEMKDKLFKPELIFGAIILAVAIVFCLQFKVVKGLIVLFAAVNLLSFGTIFAVRAVLCFTQKNRPVWRVFCIIFAALFITCGVLALVFDNLENNICLTVCYYVIGALLGLAGISQVVLAIKESMRKAKEGKAIVPTNEQPSPKAKKEDKVVAEEKVEELDYTNPEDIKAIEDKSE